MTDDTMAIVKARDEDALRLRVAGQVVEYTLRQVMSKIMPANLKNPDRDTRDFVLFCNAYGANPFAKEAFPVPYAGVCANILAVAYWRRIAAESGKYNGKQVYFFDKDFAPVPKTAPLAEPKSPKPGEIVGAACKAHVKGMDYPIEEIVLLEEVDTGQGQLWKPLQKKHGLEMTAERRALRTAFPPPVGLPMMTGAAAVEMEARVLSMEMEAEAAAIGAPDAAPTTDSFSPEDLAAWCKLEGFTPEQAKLAQDRCQCGAYKVRDLTDKQRRMIQAYLDTSRNVIDVEPEEVEPEPQPDPPMTPGEEAEVAALGSLDPKPGPMTVDYDSLDGEELLEAYLVLAAAAGLNAQAGLNRYGRFNNREDALTDVERLKSQVRTKGARTDGKLAV